MAKALKFGGTSMANAQSIMRVRDIILGDRDAEYVVVSAPGKREKTDTKVTDLLIRLHGETDTRGRREVMDVIAERFREIESGLGLSLDLSSDLEEIFRRTEEGASYDYVVSRGEYLAAKVLAALIGYKFVDAADIIKFRGGTLDAEETQRLASEALDKAGRAVVPGFYGSDENGRIKAFSRGGSDVSGAIVARAVHASVYENWTDVNGFMVVDPRIVKNPEIIRMVTYRELRELSYMGASVLHPEAVFPVNLAGIPINIRNTNRPKDKGTMIVESTCSKPKYTITGIAGKKGFASINIEKDMMNSEIGFGRKVLQVFEENGLSFEHVPSGIDTLTVFVHQDEFQEKEQSVIAGLHRAVNPDTIELESDLALIAVVGRGMKRTRGTAGRIFSALAHAHVNVKMIDQGSSELNIIIGVENRDFEAAIKAIYDIFVTVSL